MAVLYHLDTPCQQSTCPIAQIVHQGVARTQCKSFLRLVLGAGGGLHLKRTKILGIDGHHETMGQTSMYGWWHRQSPLLVVVDRLNCQTSRQRSAVHDRFDHLSGTRPDPAQDAVSHKSKCLVPHVHVCLVDVTAQTRALEAVAVGVQA